MRSNSYGWAEMMKRCLIAGVWFALGLDAQPGALSPPQAEFAKKRRELPSESVYEDYRAIRQADSIDAQHVLRAAKAARAHVVLWSGDRRWDGMRDGVLFIDARGHPVFKERQGNMTTHILARELSEAAILESLRAGRTYSSDDRLCDPAGFTFVAVNNLGVFEVGDRVPGTSNRLMAQLPVEARLKLFRDGELVQESTGAELNYLARQAGAWRLEAWLNADGEMRPWISSGAIHLTGEAPSIRLPSGAISDTVSLEAGIEYASGKPEDAAKHKLDVYFPKGKRDFPVLFFVHGGAWRNGDRSLYKAMGNRFAGEGIGVVIPSYRLSPANLHPAHIEDVAAAFAWTVNHIGERGGDPKRIYIAGHSAGGHLVALLTLDGRYLSKHGLNSSSIAGTFALSGVYNVEMLANVFTQDAEIRRQASPLTHVKAGETPPFLVTYCQWDYPFLPRQARQFHEALRKAGVKSDLVYVAGEDHISEMVNIVKEGDPTAKAILDRIRR
jgi:acetyl esterase/lipase